MIAQELDIRGVTAVDLDPAVTRAMELRAKQHSYSQIAAVLGRSVSWVRKSLTEAARAILTDREVYLAEQLADISLLKRELHRKYETLGTPWSDKDIAVYLKIMERQARLTGIDAPVKVEGKFDFSGRTTAELEAIALANGLALPPALPEAPE